MRRTAALALGCFAVLLLALFLYQRPDRPGTAGSGLDGQPSVTSASQEDPARSTPAKPDTVLQATPERSATAPHEVTPATAPAPPEADLDKVVQHEIAQVFEEEALRNFPLHTARAFDPLSPDPYGPRRGEVWIRIKAEQSREMKQIMAQVADLYRDLAASPEPLTVIQWVGNRPFARFEYGLDK